MLTIILILILLYPSIRNLVEGGPGMTVDLPAAGAPHGATALGASRPTSPAAAGRSPRRTRRTGVVVARSC